MRRLSQVTFAVLTIAVFATPAGAEGSYTVEAGDTLSEIAEGENSDVGAIVDANDLVDVDDIKVGQILVIPDGTTDVSRARASSSDDETMVSYFYEVQAGDTLGAIAREFGVPTSELAAANQITNHNSITAGQGLRVPGQSGRSSLFSYPNFPDALAGKPDRLALTGTFEHWAAMNGISTDLLMAVAYQESGWQNAVTSHKGATGIGQLMPVTSEWIANVLIGQPDLDPADAEDNIRMSARYLGWLIQVVGSEDRAIAAYYQGPTSVRVIGNYLDTDMYVSSVNALRTKFTPTN